MDVMTDSTRHAGRWTLEDRFASAWHYLPVEVGTGAAGLRVELEYDRAGGAVLDLGCLAPAGFRGCINPTESTRIAATVWRSRPPSKVSSRVRATSSSPLRLRPAPRSSSW